MSGMEIVRRIAPELDERELRFETPSVDVQVTHLPTGIQVVATSRSEQCAREAAVLELAGLVADHRAQHPDGSE